MDEDDLTASGSASGLQDESDRIDALLSSALADQAREKRMLTETVYGARSALVKAQEEIAGLREQISSRDRELVEAVTSRLEGSGSRGLLPRIEALEEAIIQLAGRVAELPSMIRRDLEASAVALGERVGEEADSMLAQMREDELNIVRTVVDLSERSTGELKRILSSSRSDLKQAVASSASELAQMLESSRASLEQAAAASMQELIEHLSQAAKDTIESGRSTAELMVEHLEGYLAKRDDSLQRVRDQLLIDLFHKLGQSLGQRDRKKVARSLSQQSGTGALLAARPAPAGPSPPPPAPGTFRAPPARISQIPAPPSALRGPAGTGIPESFPSRPLSGPEPIAAPLSRAELSRDYLLPAPPLEPTDLPKQSPDGPASVVPRQKRSASGGAGGGAGKTARGRAGSFEESKPSGPRSRTGLPGSGGAPRSIRRT